MFRLTQVKAGGARIQERQVQLHCRPAHTQIKSSPLHQVALLVGPPAAIGKQVAPRHAGGQAAPRQLQRRQLHPAAGMPRPAVVSHHRVKPVGAVAAARDDHIVGCRQTEARSQESGMKHWEARTQFRDASAAEAAYLCRTGGDDS